MSKENYKKYDKLIKYKPYSNKQAKKSIKKIADIAVMASKVGMSYGEFVAKNNL